ncbi:RtcB family protein [Treponema sp.]|uniref:RtcB family protein n=1 Tax=Treponema sp. TaxID=166 RepID=UPI00388E30A6
MEIIKGKNASARVFSDTMEPYAGMQIQKICDNGVSIGQTICVMPDVHPGYVAPIGLSMTVGNSILPNLVGIDVGCGMTIARIIKHRGLEFKQLDSLIRERIPSGFEIRKNPHRFIEQFDFSELICRKHIRQENTALSLGSCGSGNHFIEIDRGDSGIYILVHSGSRHLGKEVTDHYLNCGRKLLRKQGIEIPYELTYLNGPLMEDYLHDIKMVQKFAELNRLAIIDEIIKGMKWKTEEPYSCIHNYIDFDNGELGKPILRKGAISARKNQSVIIPINMRDGVILGRGKGNPEWNYSAPHGSGRVMKREDVKKSFTVSSFKASMKGIYSSCIGAGTLDEAPFAYRGIDEIKNAIEPTVEVTEILKPVYNFKAGGEE